MELLFFDCKFVKCAAVGNLPGRRLSLGWLWCLWMTVAHGSSVRVGLRRRRWLRTPQAVPHTSHRGIVIRHRIHVVRRGRLIGRVLRLWLLLLHRMGCPMPCVWSTGITWWSHATRGGRIVSIVGVPTEFDDTRTDEKGKISNANPARDTTIRTETFMDEWRELDDIFSQNTSSLDMPHEI